MAIAIAIVLAVIIVAAIWFAYVQTKPQASLLSPTLKILAEQEKQRWHIAANVSSAVRKQLVDAGVVFQQVAEISDEDLTNLEEKVFSGSDVALAQTLAWLHFLRQDRGATRSLLRADETSPLLTLCCEIADYFSQFSSAPRERFFARHMVSESELALVAAARGHSPGDYLQQNKAGSAEGLASHVQKLGEFLQRISEIFSPDWDLEAAAVSGFLIYKLSRIGAGHSSPAPNNPYLLTIWSALHPPTEAAVRPASIREHGKVRLRLV